jgi:hypothetical protein
VLNEDNYENVSFFAAPVSEELEDLFTTLDTSITYEMIVAELGSPITDVLAAHEGFKLLAFEFTGPQSGTLLKAGFSEYELAGDATDEMIEVEITAVPAPHEPAEPITASIVGSPITVTATAPNNLHQGGISAYTEFTIQLEHATVASDYFDYNPEWFSPSVVGLYYAITADEGDTQIFVEIGGMPTAASSSQAEITFPASLLLDDNGDYNTDPVAVSGSVIYDIDKAEDATVPDITDITFDSSMFAPFYANDPSTAANKDIGWLYVTGGTGILPTYSFVDDENYPDNEYFTFYYNTLRVKTALTEAKTYSIKIKAEDSGKTYEEVIEIPVAELVPFTGFDFTPPAGKTLVIGSVPSGDEDLYQGTGRYAVIGTIIPEGGKAPITFRKITGEGDTDNDKFTVSSNGSLQVSSTNGLTEVKEYSILVSGQDSSSPRVTIEKVITFDIGYAPAEEPSANVSYERVIEGIVGTSFRGPVQVRIDLTNADAADSLADDEDVTSWFSPAVEGLTYKIDSASYGSIYIEVSGTPTEALSTDDVTITIPADKLLDSNGNSTIEEPLVIETGVSYEILDYVAMIGTTKYLSLQDAVDRLSADTIITILKDIELSAPITIPYRISGGAKVTLKTETDGLTISPSEDFEGNSLFSISLQTDLILGNGSGASHTPTLIIDGKNQVNTLVTVSADNTNGAGVQLYSGVELKNAAQRGIYANSTGNWSASVFINGGAIQSCPIGVEFGYGANPNMGGGIIYGSDGGENANAVSVYNAGSYPFPGNVGILSGLSPTGGPAGDGQYTQTFGTAP